MYLSIYDSACVRYMYVLMHLSLHIHTQTGWEKCVLFIVIVLALFIILHGFKLPRVITSFGLKDLLLAFLVAWVYQRPICPLMSFWMCFYLALIFDIYFHCLTDFFSNFHFLSFQFDCDVPKCLFLYICPAWFPYLTLGIDVFQQYWKILSHYFFSYC